MNKMSPYERRAMTDIASWKTPQRSWLDQLGSLAGKPLDFATSTVMATGVGEMMNKAINGSLVALNDMTATTVNQETVLAKFRAAGHDVTVPAPTVSVVDTIGAGDTVHGALLAWLHARGALDRDAVTALDGPAWRDALAFAAEAAAVTVSRPGADPPWGHELARAGAGPHPPDGAD